MTTENKKQSRRRFILWGAASAAAISAIKFIRPGQKKETVKMLTQDGKLVEVDIAAVPKSRKKITDKELQTWIRK